MWYFCNTYNAVQVLMPTFPLSAPPIADSDYNSVDKSFSFSPDGSSTNCLNVTILDDGITENAETFTLLLVAKDEPDSQFDSVTVTILDKKGKIDRYTCTSSDCTTSIHPYSYYVLVLTKHIS